jgi:hypothetical protein
MILSETHLQQFLEICIHTLLEDDLLLNYLLEDVHVAGSLERQCAEVEFVSDYTERPNITLLSVLQLQSLRTEVVG